MIIEDTLWSALLLFNLPVCGVSGDNYRFEPELNTNELVLANLLISAHEQLLDSSECLALQTAITEEQWIAYQDIRKAPIRQAREARYRAETDPVRMAVDEQYTLGSSDWLAAIEAWKAEKEKIRLACPYPE